MKSPHFGDFQGLWEGWDRFIVLPFPQTGISTAFAREKAIAIFLYGSESMSALAIWHSSSRNIGRVKPVVVT
jgi:hypothetical protein